tara:strand:+ start:990 stop:1520 length:531 start_codon:yes stop_codon:yes gene_type:complete
MSQLKVDSIIPNTGVPTGGGGGIVQIVHGTKTGEVTSTDTSFVDTGLTATITPKFSTSKILVIIDQPYHMSRDANTCGGGFKVLRDSTEIATPNGTGGSGGTSPYACYYNATGATAMSIIDRWSFMILDSPAKTSATIYKVQMACATDANSGRIRAQYSGTSGDQKGHIALLEVSA